MMHMSRDLSTFSKIKSGLELRKNFSFFEMLLGVKIFLTPQVDT